MPSGVDLTHYSEHLLVVMPSGVDLTHYSEHLLVVMPSGVDLNTLTGGDAVGC